MLVFIVLGALPGTHGPDWALEIVEIRQIPPAKAQIRARDKKDMMIVFRMVLMQMDEKKQQYSPSRMAIFPVAGLKFYNNVLE